MRYALMTSASFLFAATAAICSLLPLAVPVTTAADIECSSPIELAERVAAAKRKLRATSNKKTSPQQPSSQIQFVRYADRSADDDDYDDGGLDELGLRGVATHVISPEDVVFLRTAIPIEKFVAGSGYDAEKDAYGTNSGTGAAVADHKKNLLGLELKQLASEAEGFASEGEYRRFLDIREQVRARTEAELGLCPGTLHIDFTHLSQKTRGGVHRPHADNCFHRMEGGVASCDGTRPHPHPQRVAASILYLNGAESFGGGEFYWADPRSSRPRLLLVPPRAGTMTFFTAGPENLHGALPVKPMEGTTEENTCDSADGSDGSSYRKSKVGGEEPRRQYLAMWYTVQKEYAEAIPKYRQNDSD